MSSFDIDYLSNGIKLITRKNPHTPRIAVNMFIDSGMKNENKAGISSLAGRLLLQGTQSRNSEQLAIELDSNAIEMSIDTKQDYIKIKSLFLNEEFDKALELLTDIVKYSTFENFDKEVRKLSGEIEVELDSPRAKAIDNLVKNIYPNHPYGHTYTKVIKDLPAITLNSTKDFYYLDSISKRITIVVVGDINKDSIIKVFEDKFANLSRDGKEQETLKIQEITENKIVTISKNDAAQAQVIQGWLAPTIFSDDFAALSLLNMILGSSGLSSRLFVELRDKKGLAYHVRSSYEPLKSSGIFTVYIGTAPCNINIALDGFNVEIKKLQEELVLDKELADAKSNYLGKRAFYHETNLQQAHYLGFYDIMGLGADYDDKIVEKIKKVSANDIREAANRYLSQNSIISILAPDQYLKSF
jgi:predicted Zn-dependent peptidase